MEASRNFGWIVRQYLRPFHNQLVRTIEEGIEAGEFRRVDADHMALSILGMTTSYFAAAPILSEIVGRDLLAPKSIEARKQALLDFLDHGLNRGLNRGPNRGLNRGLNKSSSSEGAKSR
jgi:AcrR family transcriptional regulator